MENTRRPGLLLSALVLACFAFLQPADWSTTAHSSPPFMRTTLSNSVAVIDFAAITTIAVGRSPGRLALTPDGLRAYFQVAGSNTVSLIDTLNRTVTAAIPTGHSGPEEITVTPDSGCGPRLKWYSL